MPGPAPKPNAVGHRTRKSTDLVKTKTVLPALVPEPPEGLLASTRADWVALWTSPLAKTLVAETDGPALRRLYGLYDQRERLARAVKKAGHMVTGSKGQPVLNPMLREVGSMDAELRQLEDRFGLSPLARMRLGIAMGEAARSLADLNSAVLEDDDEEAEDIRLVGG